jgi:hypothetical protein
MTHPGTHALAVAASLFILATTGCRGGRDPATAAATAAFEQISFVLPGGEVLVPQSEWAFALVSAPRDSADRYVNVSVDENWVVENLILPAMATAEDSVSFAYSFGLGVTRGDTVKTLRYGLAVTPEPLGTAPDSRSQAAVTQTRVTLTCRDGAPPELATGTRARGGKIVPGSRARHNAPKTIPNQEAGTNECAPVGVSNSLQWLNGRYDLGLADADISIDAMKAAVGWQAEGAPADWAARKDAHMQASGFPVTTRYTRSIEEARDGIREGCDVELDLDGHVAVIVGMAQFEDGSWQIELREDLEQGARRRREEPHPMARYDPTSRRFTGKGYDMVVDGFVVECPIR